MTVSFNENYFQLFEIEKSVFIDFNVLEEKYLELQKEFHPDKYVNASDQEKRISLQITSYINEAYNTLKNDYLKSIYLLKIEGYKLEDQNNTISDSVFLVHQMELREESEKIKINKNPKEYENFDIQALLVQRMEQSNIMTEEYTQYLANEIDAWNKLFPNGPEKLWKFLHYLIEKCKEKNIF